MLFLKKYLGSCLPVEAGEPISQFIQERKGPTTLGTISTQNAGGGPRYRTAGLLSCSNRGSDRLTERWVRKEASG